MRRTAAVSALLVLVISLTLSQIPTNGLVAYYPFNGNANDESGIGNNGVVYGAVLAADRFLNPEKAYAFDGINDKIVVLNPTILNFNSSQDFTISLWMKCLPTVAMDAGILSKAIRNGDPPKEWFQITVRNKKAYLQWGYTYNAEQANVSGTSLLNDNKWHNVVVLVSRTNSAASLWIDGAKESETSNSSFALAIDNPNNMLMGVERNGTVFFPGTLDDIRIYNRALSDSEIQALYHEGDWVDLTQGLMAFYPFNDNSLDESGQGHPLTVNSAVSGTDRFNNLACAYAFNGTSSYLISGASNFLDDNASGAFSVWFKTTSANGCVLAYSTVTSMSSAFMIEAANGNVFVDLKYGGDGKDIYQRGTTSLQLNRWYHLVVNADGTSPWKIYLDGVLEPTTFFSNIPASGAQWISDMNGVSDYDHFVCVGALRRSSTQGYFNGTIDDIRIYDRALTELEVQTLYHEGNWIGNPQLTLLSPNTGERWSVGSTQAVAWTSSGFENVRIELSTDDGVTWESAPIASSTDAVGGSYEWKPIPDKPSPMCRLKVSSVANPGLSAMSERFEICSPKVLYEGPIDLDIYSGDNTVPSGEKLNTIVRVLGPPTITPGRTFNLTFEVFPQGYSDPTPWKLETAQIAAVIPDGKGQITDVQRQYLYVNNAGNGSWIGAAPYTRLYYAIAYWYQFTFESLLSLFGEWVDVQFESPIVKALDDTHGFVSTVYSVKQLSTLTELQQWGIYDFENQYDYYQIPDDGGMSGVLGQKTAKKYIIPITLSSVKTVMALNLEALTCSQSLTGQTNLAVLPKPSGFENNPSRCAVSLDIGKLYGFGTSDGPNSTAETFPQGLPEAVYYHGTHDLTRYFESETSTIEDGLSIRVLGPSRVTANQPFNLVVEILPNGYNEPYPWKLASASISLLIPKNKGRLTSVPRQEVFENLSNGVGSWQTAEPPSEFWAGIKYFEMFAFDVILGRAGWIGMAAGILMNFVETLHDVSSIEILGPDEWRQVYKIQNQFNTYQLPEQWRAGVFAGTVSAKRVVIPLVVSDPKTAIDIDLKDIQLEYEVPMGPIALAWLDASLILGINLGQCTSDPNPLLAAHDQRIISSVGDVSFDASPTGVKLGIHRITGSGFVTVNKYTNVPIGSLGKVASSNTDYRWLILTAPSLNVKADVRFNIADIPNSGVEEGEDSLYLHSRSSTSGGDFANVYRLQYVDNGTPGDPLDDYLQANDVLDFGEFRFARGEMLSSVPTLSGWNMVSLPVTPTDSSIASIFPGAVSYAYAFDSTYLPALTLTPGRGYWLKMQSSGTHEVCGAPVTSREVPLRVGWNMIGIYGIDVSVSTITTFPAGIINSPFFEYGGGYRATAVLQRGKGYWVKATQEGVLNLPLLQAKVAAEDTLSRDSSVTITLNAADGSQGVLYLTNEKESSGSGELPPLPPTGVFDVRFSSNKGIESLDQGRHELLLSSATYPVTLTCENMKGRTLRVRDGVDGTLMDGTLREGMPVVVTERLSRLVMELEGASLGIPAQFELSQNYPNPFNPSTVIKYALPHKSHVTLIVFDILGQQVLTAIQSEQEAGHHEYAFDASGFASGVYFYRLQAGDFISTKKMLVLR